MEFDHCSEVHVECLHFGWMDLSCLRPLIDRTDGYQHVLQVTNRVLTANPKLAWESKRTALEFRHETCAPTTQGGMGCA